MATRIEFIDPRLDVSSLKGRSVLITGGAAGIGLACATRIAEAGALVTIADLQNASGQTAARDLASKGHGVQFVQCDVTNYTAQVDMFQKAITFGGGKVDIVIPNAGIVAEQNLFKMVPADVLSLDSPPPPEPGYTGCDVNLQAVYNTCYLAMHYFRLPRDAGDIYNRSIILIGSLAGYVGFPPSSTYSVSKFGVRGLFYSIRDQATHEIPAVRVNLVAPWFIETAMTKTEEFLSSEAGFLIKVMGFAPMDRLVAAVLQFAANDKLHGRAAGIFPLGNEDLSDDLEGAYAGLVVQKHMQDVMVKVSKAMQEMEAEKNKLSRQDSATTATTTSKVSGFLS
ncbi:NAD(P)-binding protein [Ophiobolus disseminans]|uniref:NAD(P)-binding protein n=1 Tax=Ophiobolus disseminans TaxID=1469910 RepID=A0A6A6ZKI8_9PLEO|nr:NAD(P)-binding protein [Ophiobolus disseminans]